MVLGVQRQSEECGWDKKHGAGNHVKHIHATPFLLNVKPVASVEALLRHCVLSLLHRDAGCDEATLFSSYPRMLHQGTSMDIHEPSPLSMSGAWVLHE